MVCVLLRAAHLRRFDMPTCLPRHRAIASCIQDSRDPCRLTGTVVRCTVPGFQSPKRRPAVGKLEVAGGERAMTQWGTAQPALSLPFPFRPVYDLPPCHVCSLRATHLIVPVLMNAHGILKTTLPAVARDAYAP